MDKKSKSKSKSKNVDWEYAYEKVGKNRMSITFHAQKKRNDVGGVVFTHFWVAVNARIKYTPLLTMTT